MSEPESTPSTPSRVRALMAIPILFSAVALGGALFVLRKISQEQGASGERLRIELTTSCAAEARDVVWLRAEAVGLGTPDLQVTPAGLALTATMPGLPDDREAIPALLARRAALAITSGGVALATQDDVARASVNLDTGGSPYTEVQLSPGAAGRVAEALRAGRSVEVALDGVSVVHQEGGDLEGDRLIMTPSEGEPRARMRQAADWAILLSSGAQPCEVQVGSVAQAPAGG